MNAFDKIIGYSSIKKELQQISDTLKNPEAYDSLGVSAPQGLLLYGEPGVGKSLMASAVIKDSGRKVFCCRKDSPNGDFVKKISPETLINRKSVCFHTAVNTVSTTNDMGIPYIYAIQPYRN